MKITVITSLYHCLSYIDAYLTALTKIENLQVVEILLLHNAPVEEEIAIIRKYQESLPNIRHIIIPERESLYITWNRGIELAKGEYIAIWNVDDIRYPDSLLKQAEALDSSPEAAMAYGDFIETSEYGAAKGIFREHPQYHTHSNEFLRSHMVGCFPMWRKAIHKKIGYFDEQFRIAADFDFQIRVARTFSFVKSTGILGEYLAANTGDNLKISSSQKLNIERTAIEIRYGQFDKIDLLFAIPAILNFDIKYTLQGGNRLEISSFFPQYTSFLLNKAPLIVIGICKLPIHAARFLVKFIR